MGLSASIVLIAVGAVLRYAVTATATALRVHVIGDILMGVGIFGLALWFILWAGSSHEAKRSSEAMRSRDAEREVAFLPDVPTNERRADDEEEARRVA